MLHVTFIAARGVRYYRTVSSRGKYIGYGLRTETATERTPTVDIFNIIIPKVGNTSVLT